MRNETFRKFVQANAFQLITAGITFNLTVLGFVVGYELFQQSTTYRIQAIENSDTKFEQRMSLLEKIPGQLDVVSSKIDSITDRMDRQGDKLNQIVQYELSTKK